MSKTLLFLNGQPVILTSEGTESVVQDNTALASSIEGQGNVESHNNAKAIFDPGMGNKLTHPSGARLEESENLGDNIRPNSVQVKVNGREVPGFMLPQDKTGTVHKVIGQTLHQSKVDYGLLSPEKIANVNVPEKGNEAESGAILQLHNALVQRVITKESNFADAGEESCGSDVFTLSANTQLLHSHVEGRTVVGSQEDSSVESLQNIVRLPIVSSQMQVDGQGVNIATDQGQVMHVGTDESQGQPRNMSTIVAIIQGEDGSTQTIELSPEEACKLNLQLLGGNVGAEQNPVHPSPVKLQELSTPHLNLATDQKNQITEIDNNSEGLEGGTSSVFPEEDRHDGIGGNGSCDISTSDADVSLGPFLLIPEYNADGSISMLQIRGSDSDVSSEVSVPEPLDSNSVSISNAQFQPSRDTSEKTLMSFPRSNQNVPVSTHQQAKKHSNIKPKHIDWKAIAPKSTPRVPGSMYLRDIAKRTKFRNLISFLDTKQTYQDIEIKAEDMETVTPTTLSASIAGLSNAVNVSPQALVIPSSAGFTLGTSSGLLRSPSPLLAERGVTPPIKVEDVALHLSHHPSSNSVLHNEHKTQLKEESSVCSDRALTIKVNTGPISVTDSTVFTTASSTTPDPSIKCEESTEALAGCSQSNSNPPSLITIVYCSSGGDETPLTVHLPGVDNTKPLGSSENPIQLVQQGNTFQALQPVKERQLEQITTLLQQSRITAPPTVHHDEIYDPKTNMKIVYKVVFPEGILHGEDDDDESKDDILWDARLGLLEEKRKGRKSKDWRKIKLHEEEEIDVEIMDENEERKKPIARTRSGRISRPPRHMVRDFKHLHPINFNDDDKDKDTPSIGYSDYAEHHQPEPEEKPPVPAIIELPRRKKREVPALTRLRYTCLTCGKLYMGRMEAHYQKFPDHRREHPLSPSDLKQSYSAIKTLSDSSKLITDEGSEINKSVLSPTPGTQASETSGEPSLPMETLTTQPINTPTSLHTQQQPSTSSHEPQFDVPTELNSVKPSRGRGRRGRRGRRSRGRGAKFGGPGRSAVAASSNPPAPVASPLNMLEKILSGYKSEDIQKAVGKRLVENLTPWQLLCFQSEGKDANGVHCSWQNRLNILLNLFKECKEDFERHLEPLPEASCNRSQESAHKETQSSALTKQLEYSAPSILKTDLDPENDVLLQPSESKNQSLYSNNDNLFNDGEADQVVADESARVNSVKVCEYLASFLGVTSGLYRPKEQSKTQSSPILCAVASTSGIRENFLSNLTNPGSVKRHLDLDESAVGETSSKRIQRDAQGSEEILEQKSTIALNNDQSAHCDIAETDVCTYPKKVEERDSVDNVSKVLEDATRNLDLSSYNLSSQISSENDLNPSQLQTSISSTSTLLTTSEGTTSLSTTLSAPHFRISLNNEGVSVSDTTLTMSHTAPCVTHTSAVTNVTSSLPIEVPHFASHNNNSVSAISSCIPLSSIDTSLMPTSTIPQVNTIQQMPLGDLDITAEDLPRLLSEGTGLVVGGSSDGDACDAPKLLDTSGDTTDLSEMLFKLQEATAGISQSQDPNLGPPVYQEHLMTSSQQMASQSLRTHSEVALPSQGYSAVGQTINPHSTSNLSLKLDTTQVNNEPSMPRLTFTGALHTSSDFHSTSDMTQSINVTEDNGKVQQVLLNQASNQQQNVNIDQSETSLVGDRERLNIGFSVSGLGSNEFEDLLKR
ncbi:uncharacterized protein LOC121861039 [Homarus americanus]|uniref:DUF4764 domain-containing protein n=1 Tax=Homarus americanus TaxID=6706 RepID=A0A8J5T8E2_HOMAM|nr:uncharacterized protein LOC121861039 [Homarus americanus]XP_042214459.1 uncharacterized protein LOC121861039 [Homarus americanus]KAG7173145.1 hypothetical protein Hamer_G008674 [Homarus americanus]